MPTINRKQKILFWIVIIGATIVFSVLFVITHKWEVLLPILGAFCGGIAGGLFRPTR